MATRAKRLLEAEAWDDVRGPDRTRDAGDERHQPGDGRGEDREAATGRGAGHQDHGTFPGWSFRASSASFEVIEPSVSPT